ncbi:MAG: rod shape-determining protein [Lactobacillaceae bacterium]|jgi:rod shape-determining protein MreB|nr:rod shape-determining protein [Lactobacillaceae bacterium]
MAFNFGKRNIGIDLGTSNTLVFLEGQGITVNEPSFTAKSLVTGELLAVGGPAKDMFEKNPPTISVVRPIRKGVISDLDSTIEMLKYFLSVVYNNNVSRPTALIGVPSGVTEVERRAVRDAMQSAGAGNVLVIDEVIAAAVGAGLPVYDAPGTMVIDLGGGTVDIATLSLGKPNSSRSTTFAGDAMNESIKNMVYSKYNYRISEDDARLLKENIGTADLNQAKEMGSMSVAGIDNLSGLPSVFEVSASDVAIALHGPLNRILEAAQATLEDTLPELVSDIVDRGIILTGGGAKLRSLDLFLSEAIHVPVFVASEPETAVARGLGEILKQPTINVK